MRVWLTERIIEIDAEGKKGFQAFRHLLSQVAQEHHVRPGMMPSLISFLAEQNMQPCMPELSPAEVSLLFPVTRKREANRLTCMRCSSSS